MSVRAAGCATGLRRFGVGWLLAALGAGLHAATFQAGEWPVDVTVVPDQPTITLGEPTWLSFKVTNRSDEGLQILVGGDYQNDLGRPASFTIRTVGQDGKWVAQLDAGDGTGGLIGPRDLPPGGSQVFRLFVPHWATFTEAGSYTFICRRTLQLLRPAPDGNFVKQPTSDVSVEVRTKLGVLPRDADRMGRLIAELGETMLRAGGEKAGDDPTVGLAWIDDPRVVPYFRRALKIRSYALKFVAVYALGKFATEEALEGLKAGMATSAADFDYTRSESSGQLAVNIRVAAAGALSRCPHPQAREFLLAQRHDEAESVRLAVLHAVARLPPAQAKPLLEETTRDQSAFVRDEAQRYLTKLGQKTQRDAPKYGSAARAR